MAEEGAARLEEPDFSSSNWYFTREEIERLSASRSDGIDHKKESSLRKVYCTYLQELGMQLKMPQVTIATAIVFCHRFFFRQSHARNDKFLIATVCLFLAGKVEETPRPLQDVVKWSYALRHKKDSDAYNRIKSNPPLYEHQRRLILQGEHFLLTIMGFDLNISHPYRPLVTAIRRFKVNNEQNAIAQVAWNFVNDGLRTSLCLQFKPHHIAAGAIFLAAKFLKARLPDGERAWWREFDVTPRQLEEVSNQMLELYEQSKTAGNPGEDHPTPSPGNFSAVENSKKTSPSSVVLSPSFDGAVDGAAVNSRVKPPEVKMEATVSVVSSSVVTEEAREVKQEFKQVKQELKEVNQEIEEAKEIKQEVKQGVLADTTIDEAKLKAALEKRRKRRGESVALAAPKQVVTDEDLLEMALESGIEEAARKRTEDHPSSLEDPEKGAQQIDLKDAEVSEGPAAKRQHTEQHTDDGLTGTAVKPEEGTDPVSKRVGPAKRQHEEDDVGATKRQRTEEEKAEEGEVVADKRDSPRRSYSPKRSYSPRRYSNSPRRYSNSPRRGHDSPRKAFDSPPPHYRPYNEGRRPQRPPPYDRRREYGREYGREQEYGHRNMGNMGRQVYYDHKQQRQNHHRYPPHQGYHSYDRR